MRSMRLFMIMIVLVLASMACLSTGVKTPASNVLFSDNFTDTSKKWDQVSEATRSTDYYNGAYRITVNGINSDVWANPAKQNFTDTRSEVDATKNGGPDDNDLGIVCRYTAVEKFYYGVISSDGYYGIMKMTANGGTPVGGDKMGQTDLVTKGAATNHIRFDCVGSTLTLYVNGTQVDQQTDSDYTAGNVGLIAGSFTTAGTDIVFDNFIVYKP